ncbi:MAG: SH3 domain-containing protein [Anaerolineae bacterium]
MAKRKLWGLWGLTGIVVLLLTAVTMEVTAVDSSASSPQAQTNRENTDFVFEEEIEIQPGMPVYLVGEEIPVRRSPDPAADVINFLQPGTRVVIQVVQQAFGQPWYRIEAGRGWNGWIPHENISINRPGD